MKLKMKEIYLPNPLCSRDENDIIPSNIGAWFEMTNSEKSGGEIEVIFGCVDGYGSYSKTVMCPTFKEIRRDSIHGRIDPMIKICFPSSLMYF